MKWLIQTSDTTVLFLFNVRSDLFLTLSYLPSLSAPIQITDRHRCVFSSAGSHMTSLSSSFAFSGVQKKWVGLVKEVQGGVGVGSVAAGETKPDTGYLKAEMGGACMPNGDTDQRLISLGAHFNLTTQNTHTHTHL